MNILEEIIENKKFEVHRKKTSMPLVFLEESAYYSRKTNSLAKALSAKNSSGIIAEFKRKSPSKGDISVGAGVAETIVGYANAGAAGISILTDTPYFGGFKEDLNIGRDKSPTTPLLRKDFIIDPYQIHESKAWGADVILLIASVLSPKEIKEFAELANELGLEVLLEVHNKKELESSPLEHIKLVGVNNRNLKNFSESNVNASLELADLIPKDKIKISESCIHDIKTINLLKKSGYSGFLMGELFMKQVSPANELAALVDQLK